MFQQSFLKTILSFSGQYKKDIFIVLLFACATSLLTLSLPYTLKLFIDSLTGVDVFVSATVLLVAYTIFSALKIVTELFSFWYTNALRPKMEEGLLESIIFRVLAFTPKQLSTIGVGEIKTSIDDLVNSVTNAIVYVGAIVARVVMFITFTMAMLLTISVELAVVIAVGMAGYVWVRYLFFKNMEELWKDSAAEDANFNGIIADVLNKIFTVQVYAKETYFSNKILTSFNSYNKSNKKASDTYDAKVAVCNIVDTFFYLLALCTVYILYTQGKTTIGDIVLVTTLMSKIFSEVGIISYQFVSAIEKKTKYKVYYDKLIQPVDPILITQEKPKEKTLISFENINFSYSEDAESVLNGLSFTVKKGEKVGVVGYTGAGKSSLFKLLLGFYAPQRGGVFFNGMNVMNYKVQDLRSEMSLVSQDSALLNDTIEENIRFGCEGKSLRDIEGVSKMACIHENILAMENGYQSLAGVDGKNISGGQAQRLSIARAILKDAQVVLMDESTSALDSITENTLQTNMWTWLTDKTAIVIAHRLSTLKHLDKIIVLDKGRIVEEGTHDTLIENDGLYSRMWSLQSKGILPEREE